VAGLSILREIVPQMSATKNGIPEHPNSLRAVNRCRLPRRCSRTVLHLPVLGHVAHRPQGRGTALWGGERRGSGRIVGHFYLIRIVEGYPVIRQ
jgi:hypothetical protein